MSITILIVDDDKTARESLAKTMRQEGYEVVVVSNGDVAMNVLESADIDVMLLEIGVPGIKGIEVIQMAREISPDVQVILIAQEPTLDSAIHAVRHGAHDYLPKPFHPQLLLSSIARAAARRHMNVRKHQILEQIENALQKLRDIEGLDQPSNHKRQLVELPAGVIADFSQRVIWRDAIKVQLAPLENKLLEIFVRNWGRVLKHTELIFLVQGYRVSELDAPVILRPLVSRLRGKLTIISPGEEWITNVRGLGYVFDAKKD